MGIYRYKSGNLEPLTNEGGTSGLPVGAVVAFAGGRPNSNWLLCDGSEFDTDTYGALYTYLGSNKTPDLRECVLVGAGQNTTNTIETHDVYEVGEFKDDQLQSHAHRFSYAYSGGGSAVGLWGQPGSQFTTNEAVVDARVGTTTHGKQTGVNYFIKATSAGLDIDPDLYAYKQYVRDQNEMSDYEEFPITTSNQTVEYDGELLLTMLQQNVVVRIYVNDVEVSLYGFSNLSRQDWTITLKKGDTIRANLTPEKSYARWYKKRDYSDRS